MQLGNQNLSNATPEYTPDENREPGSGFPFDLLKRDYRLWVLALLKYWKYLVGIPAGCGILVLLVCWFTTQSVYESSCALVRYEITDVRNSGLPEGYSPVQMTVILNMLRSRANLKKTIEKLNLHMSTDALFRMVSIKLPEKRSNYIYIQVSSRNADLAAQIANTLSASFIDDYKQLIRNNLAEGFNTLERNYVQLTNEIDTLNARKKELNRQFGASSVEAELGLVNEKIASLENTVNLEYTTLSALRTKLADLEATLKQTPEEVQVYEEKNTERQTALEREKVELAELRQRYTEENPIIQKKISIIAIMEEELKKNKKTNSQSKVVFGKNMVYTNLKTEFMRMRVELVGGETRHKEFLEQLVKLRARRQLLLDALPRFTTLKDQIEQKQHLLSKIELSRKELEMFLERSYSDISIYEQAVPSSTALPKRLLIKAAAAGIGGLFLTFFVVGLLELLNMRVRSRADVVESLHLRPLGMVPALATEKRAEFYSSLQTMVTQAKTLLAGNEKPALIAVAPVSQSDTDDELQHQVIELLDIRRLRAAVIRCGAEFSGEANMHLLNDFFYGLSDKLPMPTENGEFFFMLDDMAFISPPTPDKLKKMKRFLAEDFDVILWDLFEYELNPQLFRQLCLQSDMTVVPLRFNQTSKLRIFNCLKMLNKDKVPHLCAVLHNVSVKNYYLVS